MKITVISDTHYKEHYIIDKAILNSIEESEYLIHCGDFSSVEFYNEIKQCKKLRMVRGNNDYSLPDHIPYINELQVYDKKIVFMHGHTVNLDSLLYRFASYDFILFGHTHLPYHKIVGKQTLLNPGSVTRNRGGLTYNTFAILEIFPDERNAKVEFVKMDK